MPIRSRSQEIGDLGEKLFAYSVAEDGAWISRKLQEDYGIDFELELSTPEVSGHLLRVQVKSVSDADASNLRVSVRVPSALLRYAESCRYPVVLALMDVGAKKGWYLWVQDWILQNKLHVRALTQDSLRVDVPNGNDLTTGLRCDLRAIARWQTSTQVTLSLLDCARAAAFSGDARVFASVAKLVGDFASLLDAAGLRSIVKAIIEMGEASWRSHEGWELSQALFTFCREAGDLFTTEDIISLVVRESTYSRTGVSALGLLYDHYPEHLRLISLPSQFESTGDWPIGYYCRLREKYLGKSSVDILCAGDTDFRIGDLTLDTADRDNWLDKWANRGDSIVLERIRRLNVPERPL